MNVNAALLLLPLALVVACASSPTPSEPPAPKEAVIARVNGVDIPRSRLDRELETRGAVSRVVLQVHDEIVLEVAPDERDDIVELTVSTMRGAYEMRVPLEVNVSLGATWAAAKG